jgi:hypothetical protein
VKTKGTRKRKAEGSDSGLMSARALLERIGQEEEKDEPRLTAREQAYVERAKAAQEMQERAFDRPTLTQAGMMLASLRGAGPLMVKRFREGGDVDLNEEIASGFAGGREPGKAEELFRAMVEGGQGFLGLEPGRRGSEAYRTGQALSNLPALALPAAAVKGTGKAKDALKALGKKETPVVNPARVFEEVDKLPTNQYIDEVRSAHIGGVGDFGDSDAKYFFDRVPGGKQYIKRSQQVAKKNLGNQFMGYRLMSRDEFEALQAGDVGELLSFSLDRNAAEALRNFVKNQNRKDLVVAQVPLTPKHVVAFGSPGEKEIIVDTAQGWSMDDFKLADPVKKAEAKEPKAPEIKKSGKLTEVEKELLQRGGERQAKRLQRAADEIPGLEDQYQSNALIRAFLGRKGYPYQGVMTMKPGDFEEFALPLDFPLSQYSKENIENLRNVLAQGGSFDDVPFLMIDRKNNIPFIANHEGRHRTRALRAEGQPKTLVEVYPRSGLEMGADDMPMKATEWLEKFNEALGEGRLVVPEDIVELYDPATVVDMFKKRFALPLPEVYAQGGEVSTEDFIRKREKGSPPDGEVPTDDYIQQMMTGTPPSDKSTFNIGKLLTQYEISPADAAAFLGRAGAGVSLAMQPSEAKSMTMDEYLAMKQAPLDFGGAVPSETNAARAMLQAIKSRNPAQGAQAAQEMMRVYSGYGDEVKGRFDVSKTDPRSDMGRALYASTSPAVASESAVGRLAAKGIMPEASAVYPLDIPKQSILFLEQEYPSALALKLKKFANKTPIPEGPTVTGEDLYESIRKLPKEKQGEAVRLLGFKGAQFLPGGKALSTGNFAIFNTDGTVSAITGKQFQEGGEVTRFIKAHA